VGSTIITEFTFQFVGRLTEEDRSASVRFLRKDGDPGAAQEARDHRVGFRMTRARHFIVRLAESHLTPRLFGQILWRIERLAWHPT
jgi:hypothetical protein